MNYNTDGFNERSNYINNNNNKITSHSSYDNGMAKMIISENKPDIKTVEKVDLNEKVEEAKGKREDFILMNKNINNASKFTKNQIFNRNKLFK